jgi:hypothetical protein
VTAVALEPTPEQQERPPAIAPSEDRAMQPKDAAKILGMSVSTLRASRHVPYILEPSTRVGGRPRRKYLLSDLYAYLRKHRVDPRERRVS